MGDGDECEGAFADGLAVQVGHAVFGDDVVDVGAVGDDAGALGEGGDDARDGVAFGGGGHGDDGLAAAAASGAAHEVDLSAEAGVELGAERVGADLSGEVDLESDVDGDHLVVACDEEGVVDVFGGVELEEGVVVDVVVELACAHGEGGDDLVSADGLLGAGDGAALDEVDDPVAEHLGVDAEVFLVFEELGDGLGDVSDAALDGGAVFDEAGDVGADLAEAVVDGVGGGFEDGLGLLDEDIDLVDVEVAVAVGAGHLVVDLCDDVLGVERGGADDVDGDAERAEAARVGG